jgi:hypothetical protein
MMIDLSILDVMLKIVSQTFLSPFESGFEVVQDSCHGTNVEKFCLTQSFLCYNCKEIEITKFC